jgi:hypothetical protein
MTYLKLGCCKLDINPKRHESFLIFRLTRSQINLTPWLCGELEMSANRRQVMKGIENGGLMKGKVRPLGGFRQNRNGCSNQSPF